MSQDLEITPSLSIPLRELRFSASRSSGPGGQHVNTTDTRVELRWNLRTSTALSETQRARLLQVLDRRLTRQGELILTCDQHRSQHRNHQEVLARLGALVARALAPRRPRVSTRPSAAARERRLRAKRARAELKRQRRSPPED
jgi:ribosome-associated protein